MPLSRIHHRLTLAMPHATSGLLVLLCLAPAGLSAAPDFWDEIPPSPSTDLPAEVRDDYWHGQFQRVNREVSGAKDTEMVFFGDSITWHWSLGGGPGLEVWKKDFSQYNPINMGNSGDITPVMLYRVTHGNLDFPKGEQPKVAVLLCGTNNFGVTQSDGGKETWKLGADCPPLDIANGRRAIAQAFRRRLPNTRVIMMAILPVADPVKWAKCQQVNAINAADKFDPDEVAYIDLQDKFLLPDGTINKALFKDGTHLTGEGYQVWSKGIAPVVRKFMEAPPLDPVKVMLIGGSITEGRDSGGSYRRHLDGMLRRGGHRIDLIGSMKKHNADSTEPDSYQFDADHEGHTGKDSAWMADNMPRLLEGNVPDIAVIELGADEISPSGNDPGPLTDGIIGNIQRVTEALRAKNPEVEIVLSKAIVPKGREEAGRALNAKISDCARKISTSKQPVVLADPNEGFDPSKDLVEGGIQPNESGARKIAATLAEAMAPLLGATRGIRE